MLGLAAIVYLTTLFGSMFALAFGATRKRTNPTRSAETGGFEPPRELNTP